MPTSAPMIFDPQPYAMAAEAIARRPVPVAAVVELLALALPECDHCGRPVTGRQVRNPGYEAWDERVFCTWDCLDLAAEDESQSRWVA